MQFPLLKPQSKQNEDWSTLHYLCYEAYETVNRIRGWCSNLRVYKWRSIYYNLIIFNLIIYSTRGIFYYNANSCKIMAFSTAKKTLENHGIFFYNETPCKIMAFYITKKTLAKSCHFLLQRKPLQNHHILICNIICNQGCSSFLWKFSSTWSKRCI